METEFTIHTETEEIGDYMAESGKDAVEKAVSDIGPTGETKESALKNSVNIRAVPTDREHTPEYDVAVWEEEDSLNYALASNIGR